MGRTRCSQYSSLYWSRPPTNIRVTMQAWGGERTCGYVERRRPNLRHQPVSRPIAPHDQGPGGHQAVQLQGLQGEAREDEGPETSVVEESESCLRERFNEEQEAKQKEEKRLDLADFLKSKDGAFTTDHALGESVGKDDDKNEHGVKSNVSHTKDSAALLPSTDPVFQITAHEIGKSRHKTPDLGGPLKPLLSKRSRAKVTKVSTVA